MTATRTRPAGGRPKPGAKKQPVIFYGAAASLVAIILLVLLAVTMTGGGGEKEAELPLVPMGKPAVSGIAPTNYSSSASTDVFEAISTRAKDKAPLTVDELFPDKTLVDETAKAKLTRRQAVLDNDCAKAMWGAGLGKILQKGGCNQAVRAHYTDTKKGFDVTIAVFNLADAQAADRAVEAFGAGTGAGFVRPLGQPLQGFSIARGLAMGHYAVITWVQRTDGTGTERSKPLLSLLVSAANAQALYTRAAA